MVYNTGEPLIMPEPPPPPPLPPSSLPESPLVPPPPLSNFQQRLWHHLYRRCHLIHRRTAVSCTASFCIASAYRRTLHPQIDHSSEVKTSEEWGMRQLLPLPLDRSLLLLPRKIYLPAVLPKQRGLAVAPLIKGHRFH